MSVEENKAVVLRFLDQVWNEHRFGGDRKEFSDANYC